MSAAAPDAARRIPIMLPEAEAQHLAQLHLVKAREHLQEALQWCEAAGYSRTVQDDISSALAQAAYVSRVVRS